MKENITYLIDEPINLKGTLLILPKNSTIKFRKKGALINGIIEGKNSLIKGTPVFDQIRIKGTFVNKKFYTTWCEAKSISYYIEDVMNLGGDSEIIVDCDITLSDERRHVDHLNLTGNKATIYNSDRYYVENGGCDMSGLIFRWTKPAVVEPTDNYSSVIVFSSLLQRDTTIHVLLSNIDANGGAYCSYFMKQHRPDGIAPLQITNIIDNCKFSDFTRGAILTCGGTGSITNCIFENLGYETTDKLLDVIALRLGMPNKTGKELAHDYSVRKCKFSHIVASFNDINDGRELHGLIAYGNGIIITDNIFNHISTHFAEVTDAGRDAEMIYIKGSNNIISNNTITDGAGRSSDGIITLKIGGTFNNEVNNNTLVQTKDWGTFIHLSGYNHKILNNNFINRSVCERKNRLIAVYLHHCIDYEGKESVEITGNSFCFTPDLNVLAIYANNWGVVKLNSNQFENPYKLLTSTTISGESTIIGNQINVQGIDARGVGNFIDISNSKGNALLVRNNIFRFVNSKIDRFIIGSNYTFCDNYIYLKNSRLQSFLRGGENSMIVENNTVECQGNNEGIPHFLIDETSNNSIRFKKNTFVGGEISTIRTK